jgi:hypothetical protein
VTVTSESVYEPWAAPENVADLSSNTRFLSKTEPHQWICLDFHNLRIRPTCYAIRSATVAGYLKSWVIEGSLDGQEWTEIDRRRDNKDLIGEHAVAAFEVSQSVECRFIRLRQTGKNHYGTDYLSFCAFEVFGTVLE